MTEINRYGKMVTSLQCIYSIIIAINANMSVEDYIYDITKFIYTHIHGSVLRFFIVDYDNIDYAYRCIKATHVYDNSTIQLHFPLDHVYRKYILQQGCTEVYQR